MLNAALLSLLASAPPSPPSPSHATTNCKPTLRKATKPSIAMSPATTPINTPLSASKIITTLCLVVAAAGFGEGKSVCAQNEKTGADGNKYWEVPGIQDGDTPEYMCLDHTLGSAMMVGAQGKFLGQELAK